MHVLEHTLVTIEKSQTRLLFNLVGVVLPFVVEVVGYACNQHAEQFEGVDVVPHLS